MQETFAGNRAKCVFSSAFFGAVVVQIQASPKLLTSVLALVMSSFDGGTKPLPIVGCHMCRRQFVGTARLRTEAAFYYIRLVLWGVHLALVH